MKTIMDIVFPLPNDAPAAVAYLAQIDQVITEEKECGAGPMLHFLEDVRTAVEGATWPIDTPALATEILCCQMRRSLEAL